MELEKSNFPTWNESFILHSFNTFFRVERQFNKPAQPYIEISQENLHKQPKGDEPE